MEHTESTHEERVEAVLHRIGALLGGTPCGSCGGRGYRPTMELNNVKVSNWRCDECAGSGFKPFRPPLLTYGRGTTISSGRELDSTLPPGTHVWGLGTPEEGWKARAVAAEAEMRRLLHENRELRARLGENRAAERSAEQEVREGGGEGTSVAVDRLLARVAKALGEIQEAAQETLDRLAEKGGGE